MIQAEKVMGIGIRIVQEKKESEKLEGRGVRGEKEKKGNRREGGWSLGRRVCARVSVERWMDGGGGDRETKMSKVRKEKEKRRTSSSSVRLCIIHPHSPLNNNNDNNSSQSPHPPPSPPNGPLAVSVLVGSLISPAAWLPLFCLRQQPLSLLHTHTHIQRQERVVQSK